MSQRAVTLWAIALCLAVIISLKSYSLALEKRPERLHLWLVYCQMGLKKKPTGFHKKHVGVHHLVVCVVVCVADTVHVHERTPDQHIGFWVLHPLELDSFLAALVFHFIVMVMFHHKLEELDRLMPAARKSHLDSLYITQRGWLSVYITYTVMYLSLWCTELSY